MKKEKGVLFMKHRVYTIQYRPYTHEKY